MMKQHAALTRTAFGFALFLLFLSWPHFTRLAIGQLIERIEIPSSANPVGSGARAIGMGGAFIAVADDATAASWNPGGLIQLEKPEFSVVGAIFRRSEDNEFGTNPEASGRQNVTKADLNYLSLAYPFKLVGRNMIVSLNYQNLFDFTRKWDFPLNQQSAGLSLNRNVDYEQNGNLWALGLAYCVQLTPSLSFGFTLNIWEDVLYENRWEQTTREKGSGTFMGTPFTFESTSHDRFSLSGFNVNVGILWNMTDKITVGAVLKTPFAADLKRQSSFYSAIRFPTVPGADSTTVSNFTEDEKLDIPMTVGIGFAYRYSDVFTVSLDISRTEWDDYVLTDSNGRETSPITGKPVSESKIDPTYQVRLGAEYLLVYPEYVIPLRAGMFYDPAPAQGRPDDFYGFSVGSGIAYGRFIFDIAYQYRYGMNVGEHILEGFDFSQTVHEHMIYSSIIFHF